MSKQRLLLIAPPNSYRLAPYLRAAKKQGVSIQVASEGEFSLTTEIAFGLHVNLSDPQSALETIIQSARTQAYAGIIATDDFTVELAAAAAQHLDLAHNPPQSAKTTRRKDLARSVLLQAQLPVPTFKLINLRQDLDAQIKGFPFPCVLKPLALSASRGVIRVDNREAFHLACVRIGKIISQSLNEFEQNHLLVEQYVPGIEVAVEAIINAGRYQPITIFDKPEPLEGPYFEESYYITPSTLTTAHQARIHELVAQACQAYGLTTGPIHAELRLNKDEMWIIEVAARTIGGECAQLLEYTMGCSLEELVIRNAMGETLNVQPVAGCAGVLMIPTPKSGILRRIEGLLEASQLKHIESINIAIREGHELIQLPEGASYLGFIFASGPSNSVVESALREAYAKLNVVVSPLWKIQ